MSGLRGRTAPEDVLLLRRDTVFCKTNRLRHSVGFSARLQDLRIRGIYLSLMSLECVRTTSHIMALRPAVNTKTSLNAGSQSQYTLTIC